MSKRMFKFYSSDKLKFCQSEKKRRRRKPLFISYSLSLSSKTLVRSYALKQLTTIRWYAISRSLSELTIFRKKGDAPILAARLLSHSGSLHSGSLHTRDAFSWRNIPKDFSRADVLSGGWMMLCQFFEWFKKIMSNKDLLNF